MEYRSRQFLGRRNLPPGHGSLRRQGLVEYTKTHYMVRLADGTRELAVVATKNQPPTRTRIFWFCRTRGRGVRAASDFTLTQQPPPGEASFRRQRLVGYTTTHYADGTRELAVVASKNQPPN